MKTKEEILKAMEYMKISFDVAERLGDERSRSAARVAMEVLLWTIGQDGGFKTMMEGIESDLRKIDKTDGRTKR